MDSTILIIGAGASGLLAAYSAAKHGAKVKLLEKMPRPGRKLLITGKGRCNFTNVKDWNDFSLHIRSGADAVRPAFYHFPPEKIIALLESEGLETVVERGDRAFPASMRAMDVVDALVRAVRKAGVKIITDCAIEKVERLSEADVAGRQGVRFRLTSTTGRRFEGHSLLIATGGLSYPATGATGDGYGFAESLGHRVTPRFPSLTALVPEGYKTEKPEKNGHLDRSAALTETGKALCGISLKNVSLTSCINGIPAQSGFGDLDFTDGGIEGPLGFELSRKCVKALLNGHKVSLILDLKPAVGTEELLERLRKLWSGLREEPRSRNRSVRTLTAVLLGKLLPRALVAPFRKLNPDLQADDRETPDLRRLAERLKNWTFKLAGYVGYERCVVTAGGVDLAGIRPKTLASRTVPGLYFCGEVADIDADTGGYNLQLAFSTGVLAGISAAEEIRRERQGPL